MSDEKIYTAAMIVIGSEILSGRTQDENVQYLAQKLTDKGVRLQEVRVVPDVELAIIEAVQTLRSKYDYVFTSGGIGPTHDDITSVTLAKAFSVPIEQNEEAYEILRAYYGEVALTDARLKMAQIPHGALLIPNPVSSAPGFQIENVYVMAGVPKIMQAMVDYVVAAISGGALLMSQTVFCTVYESEIAEDLERLQHKYPEVDIGSYPHYTPNGSGINVVLRAINERQLIDAVEDVQRIVQLLERKK
ncbi:MAG: competence/damage-inducible protein A [Alphaproteobacteria bacterium]|nr:competence/damage-inducible protein A [Alphaproteobacteria bacterium]